jgi:hypothetical protein
MNTSANVPDINVIEDFQNLQMLIFDDVAGDKTRHMAGFFENAAQKSLELQLQSTDHEQKEFAGTVHEAYLAAKNILLIAWEKAHGAALVV